ncbi:hypothetical protein [Thermomonospora umbrina]|uniref:hypothetical protein n=1 Tax=Thermomonospora umbrina TaxID=111806 RepID=UPI001FECBB53|nr:hypothetical protein [Thermomonospora umbrina]
MDLDVPGLFERADVAGQVAVGEVERVAQVAELGPVDLGGEYSRVKGQRRRTTVVTNVTVR